MGGTDFYEEAPKSRTVKAAYVKCVEADLHEFGHGGYTGTLAEKAGYVVFDRPSRMTPEKIMNLLACAEGYWEGDNEWNDPAKMRKWDRETPEQRRDNSLRVVSVELGVKKT